MSEKQQENQAKGKINEANDDIPKPQSTNTVKKVENKEEDKKEDEHSVEEIEKELDELRPKPPSPATKRRMEREEKKKDQEIQEHKSSSTPTKATGSNEHESHHKDNELTPGEPDPSVNENVKIPVLNDHGDVELKPQQGSALNKKNNSSNAIQSTEEKTKIKE